MGFEVRRICEKNSGNLRKRGTKIEVFAQLSEREVLDRQPVNVRIELVDIAYHDLASKRLPHTRDMSKLKSLLPHLAYQNSNSDVEIIFKTFTNEQSASSMKRSTLPAR